MSEAFEKLLDKATEEMGDYTFQYTFFRLEWSNFIAENPYMRLSEAIQIMNMHDLMKPHNQETKQEKAKHLGTKKSKKKKRR